MSKRKTKKKSSGRRRRVSGISGGASGMFMAAVAIAGGAVVAEMVSSKVAPDMDEKYKGLALVAVGTVLPKFILKSELGKNVGAGMVAVGAVKALRSFGVISGVGGDYLELPVALNGTSDNLNVIAGLEDPISVIAGMDDY